MPELSNITACFTALAPGVVGQQLEHIRIASPLLLYTAITRMDEIEGKEETHRRCCAYAEKLRRRKQEHEENAAFDRTRRGFN